MMVSSGRAAVASIQGIRMASTSCAMVASCRPFFAVSLKVEEATADGSGAAMKPLASCAGLLVGLDQVFAQEGQRRLEEGEGAEEGEGDDEHDPPRSIRHRMEGRDQPGEAGGVHQHDAGDEFEEDDDHRGEGRQADAGDLGAFADDLGHRPLDQEEVEEHARERDRGDDQGDQPRDQDRSLARDLDAVFRVQALLIVGKRLVDGVDGAGEAALDASELVDRGAQARRLGAHDTKFGADQLDLVGHRLARRGDSAVHLIDAAAFLDPRQGRAHGLLGCFVEIDGGERVGRGFQRMGRGLQFRRQRADFLGQLVGAAADAVFEDDHPVGEFVGAVRGDLLGGVEPRCLAMLAEPEAPASEHPPGDEEELPEHAAHRLARHPHQQHEADDGERQRPAIGNAEKGVMCGTCEIGRCRRALRVCLVHC